ncbi:hypothetical protein GCM10011342_18680 [Aquisalinus flavus]|uniref:Penicillinase repressor n=2 Tax=Aquisalinus flavus TaxID=1526572 RepID=A0A8J2V6V9_9PROT|nr:hypothetical protein GCM10011342_18680 [Aquisalinus flavus]
MRALHEACASQLDWSLSSSRTTVQRMIDKGLLTMERREGVAHFIPAVEKARTLARLTQDFLARVLELDRPVSMSAFTGSQILDEEELERVRKLLEEDSES